MGLCVILHHLWSLGSDLHSHLSDFVFRFEPSNPSSHTLSSKTVQNCKNDHLLCRWWSTQCWGLLVLVAVKTEKSVLKKCAAYSKKRPNLKFVIWNLQLALEGCFSPVPGVHKVCVSSFSNKWRSWTVSTVVCITSVSCMDKTSTPHLAPRSTISGLKASMMMMVLRTGVWPFSRFCSIVSAFFWLSQSTVEISAKRIRKQIRDCSCGSSWCICFYGEHCNKIQSRKQGWESKASSRFSVNRLN